MVFVPDSTLSNMTIEQRNGDGPPSAIAEVEHVFSNGTLSIVSQGLQTLGPEWAERYGKETTRLDVSYNNLTELSNLGGFEKLVGIVGDNNNIKSLSGLPKLPSLTELSFNNNKLLDLGGVCTAIQKANKKLRFLSLVGNPMNPFLEVHTQDTVDYSRYRLAVLYELPTLKFLDSTSVTVSEVDKAKISGKYLKVVRPTFDEEEEDDDDKEEDHSGFTPLPENVPVKRKEAIATGVYRNKLYSSQSEGNRFILDNEL